MGNKPTVFISYSHKDEKWKDVFLPHLKTLEQEGLVTIWDDRKIDTGADWYPEIRTAMEDADAAVCLISKHYLSSDFINKEEVPYLLEKRRNEGMLLVPILLAPCPWTVTSWLKTIQMFPRNGKCIGELPGEMAVDTAFTEIALEISDQLGRQQANVTVDLAAAVSIKLEAEIIKAGILIDIDRLPVTGMELFGRQKEMELLDKAWDEGKLNAVSFVAWGGVGKSTLINKWLESMKEDNYRGAQRVFGWSFYSQGTSEKATSADLFIKEALQWFGDHDPKDGSPWDKGQRLADLIRKEKTLLILDGLESLQAEHDFEKGKIKDPALSVLLSELVKENSGLLVITTREDIPELNEAGTTVIQKNLEQISPEAGRALLRTAGVRGTDKELEDASITFGNQALALRLLGSYLYGEEGHLISHAVKISAREDIPLDKGRHPRRVIVAFEERFGEGPEVEFLRILGLFDRPAEEGAIEALLRGKTISKLTKSIRKLDRAGQRDLLTKLRKLKLIADASHHDRGKIDSHPLVREHFGAQLKTTYLNAWREGNSRLYEYFKAVAPELPNTIEEMAPLFFAVAHGCAGGKLKEAYDEVYLPRIRRRNEAFSIFRLGAIGSDLFCLSHFFEMPWHKPVIGLAGLAKGFVLNEAGYNLRALGRMTEAAEPMQAGMEMAIAQQNWINAAIAAGNLSELFLTIGQVSKAVEYAEKGRGYADKSADAFQETCNRIPHADALHQAGHFDEAERLFSEAEEMQKRRQPKQPCLYSLAGFLYCDLLLGKGDYHEVLERAKKIFEWRLPSDQLLTIALEYLFLGRGHLLKELQDGGKDYADAEKYLNGAVEGLRKAEQQQYMPLGLLARAELYRIKRDFIKTRHDLDEAMTIAIRCGMRLYEADCHLEYARLYLAEGDKEKAKEHLSTAKTMIDEMEYHRRDKDVKEIEELLVAA
ncbi:MAG: TIR domain-containing protein [Nitrospirae bacterium]|nr:TIR domain-containing protein [Nitrospirota bacterium]